MDQQTRPPELTDQVDSLARFLTAAPLPNDTTADMPPEIARLLAESIVRWQHGEIRKDGTWQPLGEVTADPEVGDVRAETIGDGTVIKLTHIPTGLTVLGESADRAWNDLRRKVAENGSETPVDQ
ncbi:hypothetical protein [Corynebacterium glyciniphilum]|uniref:hypothetical protein n=1 Tax=Corynebacterium glyciniphilum TaxID=1404244 RepID=UPI0011AB7893|nr:hypothetical protein [Corynebacterium glyciniphilum]